MHRMLTALALAPLLALAGCSTTNTDVVETHCVTNASVRMATLHRDTTYALRRSASTDTLILEETRYGRHGLPDRRITWLVELPADAPLGSSIRVDHEHGAARAWVLEALPDRDRHGAQARGSVMLDKRTEQGYEATVVLSVITRPMGPGEAEPPTLSVTRRALWRFDAPPVQVSPELDSNRG